MCAGAISEAGEGSWGVLPAGFVFLGNFEVYAKQRKDIKAGLQDLFNLLLKYKPLAERKQQQQLLLFYLGFRV